MPKDDLNYKFTENGLVYDFYDVFVPAENFRQPSLWVWGLNSNGQLGTNDDTQRLTPVTTFAGGTNWKEVSAAGSTVVIKTDGSLWTWGRNFNGELGTNDTIQRSIPTTTFAGGTNWKQVSCGSGHIAAIKTDGTLWLWGVGSSGQLGANNSNTRSTPITTFAGGNDWKQVACGLDHAAAIKTDGSLWTWGSGENGRLGNNNTANRNTPVTTFAGGTNWKSVECGDRHTIAIKIDGSLWVWGSNNSFGLSTGQLGVNDLVDRSTPVTTFVGGTNWKQVSGGAFDTAAIKTDGTLWTWGRNGTGNLGINASGGRSIPVTTFAGGNTWKSVSCGNDHVLAIKTDGSLWTWGAGTNGRLGTNDTITRSTPVTTFAGGNNWKSVTTGALHTTAIQYQPDP